MQEVLLIFGAAALFCVLTFGAAWLVAGWMTATGVRRRSTTRHRRRP